MVSTGNQVGILNSHCKFFLNFVLCLLDEQTFPVSFHSCHALWLTSLSNETATSTRTGKKIGLDWQNNNFARASRFLYISSPSVYDNNMKVPNFTFCRGREHEATTFSFSELWNSLLELNYKKIGQHLTNLTRWNKRDKLWGDPYSPLKWRFRCRRRRRRCCWSSLLMVRGMGGKSHGQTIEICKN